MIERQAELARRYLRKKKMRILKKKLGAASGEAREKILYKIRRLSPAWTEASLTQSQNQVAQPKTEKEPKKKAATPRPKKALTRDTFRKRTGYHRSIPEDSP